MLIYGLITHAPMHQGQGSSLLDRAIHSADLPCLSQFSAHFLTVSIFVALCWRLWCAFEGTEARARACALTCAGWAANEPFSASYCLAIAQCLLAEHDYKQLWSSRHSSLSATRMRLKLNLCCCGLTGRKGHAALDGGGAASAGSRHGRCHGVARTRHRLDAYQPRLSGEQTLFSVA